MSATIQTGGHNAQVLGDKPDEKHTCDECGRELHRMRHSDEHGWVEWCTYHD